VKWRTLHPESVEKLGEHDRKVATLRLGRWTWSESYLSVSVVLWSVQLGLGIGRILQTVLGDVWKTFRIEYGRAMATTSYEAVRWFGGILLRIASGGWVWYNIGVVVSSVSVDSIPEYQLMVYCVF